MKGKIIVALAAAAVALTATGPVNAGCNPTKEFATLGFADNSYVINFQATDDQNVAGAVIGRLWQAGQRATTGESTGGGCPDDVWLIGGGIYGSNGGDLGFGICDTTACPAGNLIAVVQTKSLDGTKASYTAGRVSEGGVIAFDYARTGGDWNMVDIPRPRVTVPTTGVGGARGLNVAYTLPVDLPDAAFHSAASDSLLSTGTITGYQLKTFTGAADPGRDAALWANAPGSSLLTTTAPSGSITVDCTGLGKVFVATQVVFDSGQFSSDYVSQATVVNCSNLANPGLGKGKPIKKSLGN
jgi:hypothetical protein